MAETAAPELLQLDLRLIFSDGTQENVAIPVNGPVDLLDVGVHYTSGYTSLTELLLGDAASSASEVTDGIFTWHSNEWNQLKSFKIEGYDILEGPKSERGAWGWLLTEDNYQYNTLHKDTSVDLSDQQIKIDAGDGLVEVTVNFMPRDGYILAQVSLVNNGTRDIKEWELNFLPTHGWEVVYGQPWNPNQLCQILYAVKGDMVMMLGGVAGGFEASLGLYRKHPDESGIRLSSNWITLEAGKSYSTEFILDVGDITQGEAAAVEAFRTINPPQELAIDKTRPWQPVGSVFPPFKALSDGGKGVSLGGPLTWTPEYEEEVVAWLDETAEYSVTYAKKTDALGVIVWDTDGLILEHPQKYVGAADDLHPLLDKHIDRMFQTFQDAGLRTGILVRVDRARYNYAEGRLNRWDEGVDGLERVMKYAEDRWGCTIFYVDSISKYAFKTLKTLHERHPHWLLIPEGQVARSEIWGYTAPYRRPIFQEDWDVDVAPVTQMIYPEAIGIVDVEGLPCEGPEVLDALRETLKPAIERGSRLILQMWWNHPCADNYLSIIDEVYPKATRNAGNSTTANPELTPSIDIQSAEGQTARPRVSRWLSRNESGE